MLVDRHGWRSASWAVSLSALAVVPRVLLLLRERPADVVFASHQIGAGIAAAAAGLVRSSLGSYDLAWYAAAVLCLLAAGLSLAVRPPVRSFRPALS